MPYPKHPGFYEFYHSKGREIISVLKYAEWLFFSFRGELYHIKDFPAHHYTTKMSMERAIYFIDNLNKEK